MLEYFYHFVNLKRLLFVHEYIHQIQIHVIASFIRHKDIGFIWLVLWLLSLCSLLRIFLGEQKEKIDFSFVSGWLNVTRINLNIFFVSFCLSISYLCKLHIHVGSCGRANTTQITNIVTHTRTLL